jgi:dTDP-4-dehydrorhamnose reductase
MENILVTGAAGLLGSNLCYILRSKANIIALDKNEIYIESIKSICGSALDLHLVSDLMVKYGITAIVHCAALVNLDNCEEDENYASIVNSIMTGNLSFLADKFNAQMIYISTDAVYPGIESGLYSEPEPTNPISVYGKTKLIGEYYVKQYKKNLIVRTNMYGFNYREKESFGEWIINSLKHNKDLSMFDDLYFSPILVNRLCEILLLCIERKLNGLFNICCTGSISKYEFACEIKHQFKLPGSITRSSMKSYDFLAPRTQNMGMDNSKIKNALKIEIPFVDSDIECFKELYDQGYPLKLKGGM